MVIHPQRILWPTDFSTLSSLGARYAQAIRQVFKSEVHVVHVFTPVLTADIATSLPAGVPVTYDETELIELCRERLRAVVQEQFQPADDVRSEVILGQPWSSICDYAREQKIDLLIVPTHGRTGLTRVLIGSTADRIVQHAPCPVLVVKQSQQDCVHDTPPVPA